MHCLYCDRPLALFKRLTGDGDFCSKEHRKIYQQEHNQLALERLLETKPASSKKASPKQFQTDVLPAAPKPQAPAERLPDLAGFLASFPDYASGVRGLRKLPGDPRFVGVVPDWTGIGGASREARTGPQPRAGAFQPDCFDPRTIAATFRYPSAPGFASAVRTPLNQLHATNLCPPKLRPPAFVDGFPVAAAMPGQSRCLASELLWKLREPVLPRQLAGGVVLVRGSFLRWPVVPAVVDEPLPDPFEIRLQPVSFPPFSPRMACLEERLHRTDRIGFSPP